MNNEYVLQWLEIGKNLLITAKTPCNNSKLIIYESYKEGKIECKKRL